MKVLIMSISAGCGHEKAAGAIKDFMEENIEGCTVEIVDAFKYIHPLIDKLIVGGYLSTIKATPHLYGKLYSAVDNEGAVTFSRLFNDLLSLKIRDMVKDFSPDVIVATHPFHLEMLEAVNKGKETGIPVAALVTDFSPHSSWIYDYVSAYIIPDEDMKYAFVSKGIDENRIYPFGIPVDSIFTQEVDKNAVLEELGFENKPTLLIMGGGFGIGAISNMFNLLAHSDLNVQIIVVTGNNLRLKKQIEESAESSCKNVRVFGFTNRIHELMSAADLLITKPGGLTISEAFVKGLPIAILSPIPGQEERNSDYLLQSGSAVRLGRDGSALDAIYELLNNPGRLKALSLNALHKSKPNAVRDISNLITSLAGRVISQIQNK